MDWVQVIQQVGFPIAIAAYLLWDKRTERQEVRQERKEMTDAINELSNYIRSLTGGAAK